MTCYIILILTLKYIKLGKSENLVTVDLLRLCACYAVTLMFEREILPL